MSVGSLAATALRGLANAIGGESASAAPSPLGDVATAAGAGAVVLHEIAARSLTVAEAEAFANGVQQILVDCGIEPGIVLGLSKLLEAAAPVILGAYESGIVTGGDITNQPGGGVDRRWGR